MKGKLLSGHLDHASAEAMEQEADDEARLQMEKEETTDERLIRSMDGTLYRGKSENKGGMPVDKNALYSLFQQDESRPADCLSNGRTRAADVPFALKSQHLLQRDIDTLLKKNAKLIAQGRDVLEQFC